MPTEVLTFCEALAEADAAGGDRTLLIGNGFSIAWSYDAFHYNSLFEDATFDGLSVNKEDLGKALGTVNFEAILEHLQITAAMVDLYATTDLSLADELRHDHQVIRNGLAEVIARRHPNRPMEVSDDEARHARVFLAHFKKVFSLNYDLLMYWVLNRAELPGNVPAADGFEFPDVQDRTHLTWKPQPTQATQQAYNLHGALHYYRHAPSKTLTKLRYKSDDPLVDQIRERIEADDYPTVVTEGTTADKIARIERSAYLRTARRRFSQLAGCLFIYGASLSANDDHIWGVLEAEDCEVTTLYVSLYGDADNEDNEEIIRRANRIKSRRKRAGGSDVEVKFFNAKTAAVWRDA